MRGMGSAGGIAPCREVGDAMWQSVIVARRNDTDCCLTCGARSQEAPSSRDSSSSPIPHKPTHKPTYGPLQPTALFSSRFRPRVLQRKHPPIPRSRKSISSGDAGHDQDAGRVPRDTTMNDKTRNGVWKWSLIGLFVAAALAMAASGHWLHRHQTQAIRSEKQSELKAIAELKAGQIVAWRKRAPGRRPHEFNGHHPELRCPVAPGPRSKPR